jgi:hypothetical protein
MMLDRATLIGYKVQLEAALAAVRQSLSADGQADFENTGTAATWRCPAGTAVVRTTHTRIVVLDERAFRRYMVELMPQEYRLVIQPINPEVETMHLTACLQRGGFDEEGTRPPGTELQVGGAFDGVAVTPTRGLKDQLVAAALAAIQSGQQLTLEVHRETLALRSRQEDDRDDEQPHWRP